MGSRLGRGRLYGGNRFSMDKRRLRIGQGHGRIKTERRGVMRHQIIDGRSRRIQYRRRIEAEHNGQYDQRGKG